MDREEIEKFLTERLQSGDLKPCLVDAGVQHVAVVVDASELKFFWFDHTEQLDALLRDSGASA